MINEWEALILGAIQGLTEFIPISSSSHLVFAQLLFGLREPPLLFDLILHAATLCATVIVFRTQVWGLLKACRRLPAFTSKLFQKGHLAIGDDPEAWTVILILVSTAITGAIGVAFHDALKATFASLKITGITLFLNGFLLYFARDKVPAKGKSPVTATIKDAAIIGLMQGVSILPGISRSGATIASALFLGFNRKFAGEYSFLISLPAIAGAVLMESRHGVESIHAPMGAIAIGFVASFILGIISLKLLLGWIRSGRLGYFAYYSWLVGAIATIVAFRS